MTFDLAFLLTRRARYRRVFGTEDGKKVLDDIFESCGLHRQVAVPGDPHATYFNDGMRRVALRLSSILRMTDEEMRRLSVQGETHHDDD